MSEIFSSVLEIFESLGYGCVVAQSDGHIVAKNDCAGRILKKISNDVTDEFAERCLPPVVLMTLKKSPYQFAILNINNARPILIQRTKPQCGSDLFVLIFVDTNVINMPRTDVLQLGFGLTRCEATLAAALSTGISLEQIAKLRGVGIGTVRGQLKSVFIKTNTTRQPELVAMLSRFAIVM